jgi:hypothetical protein
MSDQCGAMEFWYLDVYGCSLRRRHSDLEEEEWNVFLGDCSLGWWVLGDGIFEVFHVADVEIYEEEIYSEDLLEASDDVEYEDRRIHYARLAVLKLLDRHLGGAVMMLEETDA